MYSISKRSKSDIPDITATPVISFICEIFYTIICIVFASACNSHCQANTCRFLYRTVLVLQELIFLGIKLLKWNMNRAIFWKCTVRYRSLFHLWKHSHCLHTYIHTCMHTYIHTYIHMYFVRYVLMYIRMYVLTYVFMYVCLYIPIA